MESYSLMHRANDTYYLHGLSFNGWKIECLTNEMIKLTQKTSIHDFITWKRWLASLKSTLQKSGFLRKKTCFLLFSLNETNRRMKNLKTDIWIWTFHVHEVSSCNFMFFVQKQFAKVSKNNNCEIFSINPINPTWKFCLNPKVTFPFSK